MKKVATKKKKETLAAVQEKSQQKLFLGDETEENLSIYRYWVSKLSNRALSSTNKNKKNEI